MFIFIVQTFGKYDNTFTQTLELYRIKHNNNLCFMTTKQHGWEISEELP